MDETSASAAWTPKQLAGFRIGDMVRLPGFPAALRVIRLADPLLILEGPHGREIKAGWRAARKVQPTATPTGEREKQAQGRHNEP